MRSKQWREVVFIITGLMCAILLLGIDSAKGARLIGQRFMENRINSVNRVAQQSEYARQIAFTLSEAVQSNKKRYSLVETETGSISGQIKDEQGNPLENVRIDLLQSDDPDWAGDEAWNWVVTEQSNNEGRYTFTGLTTRRYHLNIGQQFLNDNPYIQTDQYNVQVFNGVETPDIDFTLRKAGIIWGYIKTANGNPITTARVIAHAAWTEHGDGWQESRMVSTEGIYQLWVYPSPGKFYPIHIEEAAIPGLTYKVYGGNQIISNWEYGLHPEDHGYTYIGSGTATQTFNGSYAYYIIVVEPGYLAKVDALQGSNGSYHGVPMSSNALDTDNVLGAPDGKYTSVNRYIMGGEAGGGYILVAHDSGNTSLKVYIVNDTRTNANPQYFEARMAPGLYQATLDVNGVHGPDFTLNETGRIHGRVVNKDGAGIKGVEVNPHVGLLNDSDAETGNDGYYTLVSVPVTDSAYAYLDLYEPVEQDGVKYARGRQSVGPFTITAGATVDAPVMTLLVAGTIKGQVTDENGTPVVDAEIEVEGFDIDGYQSRMEDGLHTDALGQYTCDYIAPGTYSVMASKDGWMSGTKSGVVITSGNLTDCDLVMKSANMSATVSGKITNYNLAKPKDPDGIPLPLYEENYYADYGIAPSIEISAVPADTEYTDYDLLSLGPASCVGTTNPADGYGDYFQVSGTETAGSYTLLLPPGNIDIGIFTWEGTEYGWYAIFQGWKRLNLTAGAKLTNQDLTAETSFGTLQGDISVPGGSKLKTDRTVIVAYDVDDATPSAFPDAIAEPEHSNSYSFRRMPVGKYTIRAVSEGFVTQVYENVVVSEGSTTIRNVAFASGGTLSGTVTVKGSGGPIEGASVKIGATGQTVATNTSGSYTIAGLAAGNYTVIITASGYALSSQSVTIQQGQITTGNFPLDSTVGSIEGKVTADGANVNGATVVAYNTATNAFKTATTIGGAFQITELVPGQYVLAVNATGYKVTVYPAAYPETAAITLGEGQEYILPGDITLSASLPEFTVSSSVSDAIPPILSMTFTSDVPLDADPTFTKIQGAGTMGTAVKSSDYTYDLTYTSGSSDTLVKIRIEGTSSGQAGSRTFSFEVSSELTYTASTNVTNATGGESAIMGTQDNTRVYVPPFALAGTDDNTTAVALTVKRYGDAGESVEGTDEKPLSAVYDFSFEDDTVTIAENHTVTVTMGFKLPAGMSQQEFANTFKVRYFNVNTQKWQTDGISNTSISWNNNTITFDVNHLTQFAVFAPSASSSDSGSGGKCFIETLISRKSSVHHKSVMGILGEYLKEIFK